MKSVEARFRCLKERYPNLSNFVVLGRAVKGQKFGESVIRRWFYRLVDKSEYTPSDKQRLIKHLIGMSTLEEDKKQG